MFKTVLIATAIFATLASNAMPGNRHFSVQAPKACCTCCACCKDNSCCDDKCLKGHCCDKCNCCGPACWGKGKG